MAERSCQKAPSTNITDDLQFLFNPLSATAVIEQYWMQKLLGDEKRAVEIYQQAVREGVPMPPL